MKIKSITNIFILMFVFAGCDTGSESKDISTSGSLTITGLTGYNSKYVKAANSSVADGGNYGWFAGDAANNGGILIENDSATLPVYKIVDGQPTSYIGYATVTMFISIMDGAQGSPPIATASKTVTFKSGNATVSW